MKTYHDVAGTDGGSGIVAQVTAQAARVQARLADVGYVVAVMSGKGGVGKSALTTNLAAALALDGRTVGLLDADLNGPSLAKMTGVRGQSLRAGATGVLPAEGALGLKVMSMDLFLSGDAAPVVWDAPTQQDAFTWRGMMEAGALRDFLADTEWGAIDLLLIDLPPGADRLATLVDLAPNLGGVIAVTIPSGVSQFVVGKSLTMATDVLGAPVVGLVENMASFVCSHCGEVEPLFPAGEGQRLAASHGVPYLGAIPFDPRLAACADEGRPFVALHEATPAGRAIREVARRVMEFLKGAEQP